MDATEGNLITDAAEESGQSSKYLERSVLDTVAEGATEGIGDLVCSDEQFKNNLSCGLFLIAIYATNFHVCQA